jgi:putative two-component system response regulator
MTEIKMRETLRVLVVEDNQADVDLIHEALPQTRPVSFRVEAVTRLSEALVRLKSGGIDLVLLDLGLPDSQGLETYHKLSEATLHIPVIILTSDDNDEMAVFAVREGAQDYLIKGQIGGSLLTRAVRYAVERKRTEEKNQETMEHLRKAVNTTIQVLLMAIETKDPYTAGHQRRATDLARAIATDMGLPQNIIEGIRMAGAIHDIGKIPIPVEILSKPSKLSTTEYSLIKEHARHGYEILKDVESPWPLAEMAHQHHERMDGSGYPLGLKGKDILLEARILAVADVVEAMASFRPYRPTPGIDAALEEIEKNVEVLYERAAVEACLRLFREKGFMFEQFFHS